MKNNGAELHILTEYSPFAMGFVMITEADRAIIIDGGGGAELPNIAEHVGNRPVAAWIVTHPDGDHLNALNHALKHSHPLIAQTQRFIYNFHSTEFYAKYGCAAWLERFERHNEAIRDRIYNPVAGDTFEIDGLHFEILFSRDEKYKINANNDSSLVFRVKGKRQSVLFLGDLGPYAGEDLLAKHGTYLQTDVVQMAHHGHGCVRKDVYEAINPRACIWCCQPWLYRERETVDYGHEQYGTMRTRKWMEELGVTEHYVTGDGDQVISI